MEPHHNRSLQKLEMTQRRAARYTTNNYTTTSSVNEMLQQLKWETLESRRTKIQLCSTKLSITWWIFQLITILYHLRPGVEPHTQIRCYNITLGQTLWSSVSSPELYLPGIFYQQQLLRPPTWYPSSGGLLLFNSKYHRPGPKLLVSSNED